MARGVGQHGERRFHGIMTRFAALAEEHGTPNMLVDVTKFRHSPGEQIPQWRDENIIPRYSAAGVNGVCTQWRASPRGRCQINE